MIQQWQKSCYNKNTLEFWIRYLSSGGKLAYRTPTERDVSCFSWLWECGFWTEQLYFALQVGFIHSREIQEWYTKHHSQWLEMHKVTQHRCFTAQDKRFVYCMVLKFQASARGHNFKWQAERGRDTYTSNISAQFTWIFITTQHMKKCIEYKDRSRHTNYYVLLIITECDTRKARCTEV